MSPFNSELKIWPRILQLAEVIQCPHLLEDHIKQSSALIALGAAVVP